MLEEAEWENYLKFGTSYHVCRAMWYLSMVIALYDFSLTLKDEIAYMWPARWGWIKVLYAVNRYWPLASLALGNYIYIFAHSSDSSICTFWFHFTAYCSSPVTASAGFVFSVILYVMFGRNRVILCILCVLLTAHLLASVSTGWAVAQRLIAIPLPLHAPGCLAYEVSEYALIAWVPKLIGHCTLLALHVAKVVQETRKPRYISPLMFILLRDSMLYSLTSSASTILVFIMWKWKQSLLMATVPILLVLPSLLGCRIMLNIHQCLRLSMRLPTISELTLEIPTLCAQQSDSDPDG